MNPQAIIALVIALAGFLGGWTLQGWRYGAKETQRAKQELVDQRSTAATAIRRIDTTLDAQNAATARLVALRTSADNAAVVAGRLRDELSSTVRDASASQAACLERAVTLSELYRASTDQRRELAEKADRHASDVRTLLEGWPK